MLGVECGRKGGDDYLPCKTALGVVKRQTELVSQLTRNSGWGEDEEYKMEKRVYRLASKGVMGG